MGGETISIAMITIASVICAATFVTSAFPAIARTQDPLIASTDAINDRMKTDITIIHETDSSSGNIVYIWVKNVGNNRIPQNMIANSDLFFGPEGDFMRLEYNASGSISPGWNYTLENGGDKWGQGETIKVTANTTADPVISGTEYFVKLIMYNGISDEDYFTV
ncbi:MAG: hypothetical protein C4B59_04945 [Candidatus Methanogaster sp.]|uniref:Uncharacterized protein n=1 Tax=Candidatus Methanogaster sp. TaxID=3386292 RepID=A0AC61L4N4_9EURY|nr:MAG: hypothetical protein C4B59_04945 [ANME-2 cluster archaeon]